MRYSVYRTLIIREVTEVEAESEEAAIETSEDEQWEEVSWENPYTMKAYPIVEEE